MRRCERGTSIYVARQMLVESNTRRFLTMLMRLLLSCGVALIGMHFLGEFAAAQDAEGMADHGEFAEPVRRQSYLAWMYSALGVRYTFMFFFLNVASGAFILLSLFFMFRGVSCPATLVRAIRDHLSARRSPRRRASRGTTRL